MKKSIGVLPKKRGRPATGRDPMMNFRMPPSLMETLDAWISLQPEPHPSRSEAIRVGLREWLTSVLPAAGEVKTAKARTAARKK
jgi:Arc/MetJ-type ribon-helix-helix transcriptional regulator